MGKSVWKNTPEGKTVRRNNVSAQWGSRPLELMESPALRVLSRAAHLAVLRIEIELRHHGGHDNGKLPETKQDFIEFGIHQDAIAPALRELEALGLIRITQRGRGGNAENRQPNKFLLNFMCGAVDTRDEITNSWKRIKTLEEADEIASAARADKDPAYRRNRRGKNKTQTWKPCLVPDTKTMSETAKSPDMETMSKGPDTETMSTFDTLTREASEATKLLPWSKAPLWVTDQLSPAELRAYDWACISRQSPKQQFISCNVPPSGNHFQSMEFLK
jgi:hypothetical protein